MTTAVRIASAPISWGVCEVPGWGYQFAPERVLAEMRALGLTATEFGPPGFLPDEPTARAALLKEHDLDAVGGFLPVVLHEEPEHSLDQTVRLALDGLHAAGAKHLILAAATGVDGYDTRPELESTQWRNLLTNLDRISATAAAEGITASLHPHVGTHVERYREVQRVLSGCGAALCLDTGHLLVGGTDPREITRRAADRVAHSHLKDVDAELAHQVHDGAVAYSDAVAADLFRPLGQGDVDLPGILGDLDAAGYSGYHVLEQDVMLSAEPEGVGPMADVRTSFDYLREWLA